MIFRSAAIELPAVAFHPLTGIPAQSFIRRRHFHLYLPPPPPTSPERLQHRLYIRATAIPYRALDYSYTDRSCLYVCIYIYIKHTHISIHTYSCLFSSVSFTRAALIHSLSSYSSPRLFPIGVLSPGTRRSRTKWGKTVSCHVLFYSFKKK